MRAAVAALTLQSVDRHCCCCFWEQHRYCVSSTSSSSALPRPPYRFRICFRLASFSTLGLSSVATAHCTARRSNKSSSRRSACANCVASYSYSYSSSQHMALQQQLLCLEGANVVVSDKEHLADTALAIKGGGPSRLQVIADFDMTLTKYWIDGKRGQSTHSLLKQGNTDYDRKRQELFDHYYPFEICPTLPLNEKTKLMEEWWEKTHALLIEGGLTYAAIRDSVKEAVIEFRDGVIELFEILEKNGVPVLIFSAGLADIIEEVLCQKLNKHFKNIKVVSNRMTFDAHGNLIGFRGKTIHVLNKNEHALEMAAPVHETMSSIDGPLKSDASLLENRTNVLLLGDHIGDLGMSDGFNYENRISVAFLNDNVEESMETYKKAFDIILMNDSSMHAIVHLVKELLE